MTGWADLKGQAKVCSQLLVVNMVVGWVSAAQASTAPTKALPRDWRGTQLAVREISWGLCRTLAKSLWGTNPLFLPGADFEDWFGVHRPSP